MMVEYGRLCIALFIAVYFVDFSVISTFSPQVNIKMQASTFTVKGNIGFGLQNRRSLQGSGDLKRNTLLASRSLRMPERSSCFGVSMDSASMGIELGRARKTVQSVFGSSAKARSHRVRASGTCLKSPFFKFIY